MSERERTLIRQLAKLLGEYLDEYCEERRDNRLYLAIRKTYAWFVRLDCINNKHLSH